MDGTFATRLDQAPGAALELARAAYRRAQARDDALTQAAAALALARVLNRLGEFRQALTLCDFATTQFHAHQCNDQAATALCQTAWADTFTGELAAALAASARARALTAAPRLHAQCEWIHARVLRDQSHYPDARARFEHARAFFHANQMPHDAARCERELARVAIASERAAPLSELARLKQFFQIAHCELDAALCDYETIVALVQLNRYADALTLAQATRRAFQDQRAYFFAAWCDLEMGIVYRHLNQYDASIQVLQQARTYFRAHAIRVELSTCAISLGNTFYMLNRYDEALTRYHEAAELALAEGREARAARIYNNSALVYAKQGLFAQALDHYARALYICEAKNLALLTAHIRRCRADCYRQVGQWADARCELESARVLFAAQNHREALAQCDIALAELHLARGETSTAAECLAHARAASVAEGFASYVAVCDRLLARITDDHSTAFARLDHARAVFQRHAQIVDAALCDLTAGELHWARGDDVTAQAAFERAQTILTPAFPDQGWRATYGLGRCAARLGQRTAALAHYVRALDAIAAARSILVTEQLSNDFFVHRQSVFDDALALARELDARATALDIIEASKARTFVTLLQQRGWKIPRASSDRYLADLIAREKKLRYELNALRGRVAVHTPKDVGEPLRSRAELTAVSSAALEELNAQSQAYEAVVTQLRLAAGGLAGVSAPAPFALDEFRAAQNHAFGSDWSALDYYLTDDTLTVLVVQPERVELYARALTTFDRAILEQCAGSARDQRELIYRGTLRGATAPSPSATYLQHLYRLLIPPNLTTQTLILAPHGILHALPFHALIAPDRRFLIEHHACIYAPNLQTLQHLRAPPRAAPTANPLVIGISQFGASARALPCAAIEVETLQQLFDRRGLYLRAEQATRQGVLALNESGQLATFDLVHCATHAVLDGAAPHQSRVMLADDALTTLDILDLTLRARLVTLSACQTAWSASGRGDEMLSLARAFFYAGAQALLATLWAVEDRALPELFARFYRAWNEGADAARALQRAQVEMIRAGYRPFDWAGAVLIGQA